MELEARAPSSPGDNLICVAWRYLMSSSKDYLEFAEDCERLAAESRCASDSDEVARRLTRKHEDRL